MKSGRTFEEEASRPIDRYLNDNYVNRQQFDSMISQVLAVYDLKPKTVLEIGPGNGIVSDILKKIGIQVTTFDINENLSPDIVGNLTKVKEYFSEDLFDLVLCAEVLEHLPYHHFESIINQFNWIARSNIVITLPRQHRIFLDWRLTFKVPFIKYKHFNIFLRKPSSRKWEGHHWEVDFSKEYSLQRICEDLNKQSKLMRTYVDGRNRVHQFFILEKKPIII